MKKLIRGIEKFRESYVTTHRALLEELSQGQNPRVLFITCSDSRIAPNMLTNTDLGDLFVIRNAGNIVPPYGAANGGEGASIEYAIQALGIEQVVVCGHSHCGAMKGLLQIGKLEHEMPLVYDWLNHAEATRRVVLDNYPHLSKDELLEVAIAENVLTQIENLKTYPVVRSKLFQGKLHIYGWVYLIETGEVLAFDPTTRTYVPPVTQLTDSERGEFTVGQFKSTTAPTIACELPVYQESSSGKTTVSTVQNSVQNAGHGTSASNGNRHDAAQTPIATSFNREVSNSEVPTRIYRSVRSKRRVR